jgi:hypothetical protein
MKIFSVFLAMLAFQIYSESTKKVNQISLSTGVSLPATVKESKGTTKIPLILSHGLGSTDPKRKDHMTDSWIAIAAKGAESANVRSIMYTARGHLSKLQTY